MTPWALAADFSGFVGAARRSFVLPTGWQRTSSAPDSFGVAPMPMAARALATSAVCFPTLPMALCCFL